MDVDTVFLNADIDEDIWVDIPEGTKLAANDDGIYKLRDFFYKLKQAFKNQNNDINQYLLDNGFTSLEADPCIYANNIETIVNGVNITKYLMVALYVDDLLIAGSTKIWLPRQSLFLRLNIK